MKVSIITPCARPEFLDRVKESINYPVDWYIIFDSEKIEKEFTEPWIHTYNIRGGVSGNLQRNLGLDLVEDGWVYFLDDDNQLHPQLLPTLDTIDNSTTGGFAFWQDMGGGRIRQANHSTLRVTHIDQAQYILKRDYIGDSRFIQDYCADGHFIEQLYKAKGNISIINKVLCYYNRLRW